jgi:hypothetical protein
LATFRRALQDICCVVKLNTSGNQFTTDSRHGSSAMCLRRRIIALCVAVLFLASFPHAHAGSITQVSFTMASDDRTPGASFKTATLSFTAPSPLPAGGSITVMFPSALLRSRVAAPSDGTPSASASFCINGNARPPTGCSAQGHYLMIHFNDVCPDSGSYFAPFGVLSNGCPKDVFDVFCQRGVVPVTCSKLSKLVAALPDACPPGSYFAPDIDEATKCPSPPQIIPEHSSPRCEPGIRPAGCPAAAQYIMSWFGFLCPMGSYFAPSGVQSDGCPSVQDVQCTPGAVPSSCSQVSNMIAAIPSVCPNGEFATPSGLNPASRCPNVPSYATGLYWPTVLMSNAQGATFATFHNVNISVGSMRYNQVLVITATSAVPPGKYLTLCL